MTSGFDAIALSVASARETASTSGAGATSSNSVSAGKPINPLSEADSSRSLLLASTSVFSASIISARCSAESIAAGELLATRYLSSTRLDLTSAIVNSRCAMSKSK